jgi:hypothetical protein
MNSNGKTTFGNSNATSSFTTATNVIANAVNNVKNTATNAVNAVSNAAANTTTAVTNAVGNAVVNTTNTLKNTFNSGPLADFAEPIKESVNETLTNESSIVTVPIMIILGVLIVFFILFMVFSEQITFAISVMSQKVKSLFQKSAPPAPPAAVTATPAVPQIDQAAISKMMPGKKEVFNVALDKYTYTDAEPLCKAFGAELATYEQVKDAWNKGADWCNYGWVKGQAAVYPTQQTTYNKLQAGGTPGVNGGYFDNPELRFGVNCYGVKPTENETDIRYELEKQQNLTPDALEYDKKVQNYKANMDQIPVNPFKTGAWSS